MRSKLNTKILFFVSSRTVHGRLQWLVETLPSESSGAHYSHFVYRQTNRYIFFAVSNTASMGPSCRNGYKHPTHSQKCGGFGPVRKKEKCTRSVFFFFFGSLEFHKRLIWGSLHVSIRVPYRVDDCSRETVLLFLTRTDRGNTSIHKCGKYLHLPSSREKGPRCTISKPRGWMINIPLLCYHGHFPARVGFLLESFLSRNLDSIVF